MQVLTYHSAKGLEWPVCIRCETTKPIKDRACPFGSLKKVDDIDLEGNEGVADLGKAVSWKA